MKKKVILIGINARYTHTNLAILYLKQFVKDLDSYSIEDMEFSINQDNTLILKEISPLNPDVIGLSVYIWNSKKIKSLIPLIKKQFPECLVILGGPEVSYNSKDWTDAFPDIDYIITGTGEGGFRFLLEKNFLYKEKIITTIPIDISQIQMPYSNDDLDKRKGKYIYYESTRGCLFSCSYCLSSRSDQKLQYKDISTVKDELKIILNHNPSVVKFVDRTFNASKTHCRAIWQFLISNYSKSGTVFHFEIHPGLIDNEDIRILQEVPENLFQFEIGIQSTNEESLSAIHRNHYWEKIKYPLETLTALRQIHIHLDLLVGLPFDTMETIAISFNRIYNLKPDHFQLGFLKILPGTEMEQNIEKYNIQFNKEAPYEVLSTKWLLPEEIKTEQVMAHLIDILYNTHNFPVTLIELEKLYDSPFQLYLNLADFYNSYDPIPLTRDWEKCVKFLAAFIINSTDNCDFFMDCFRWDWCNRFRSHFYPKILSSEFTKSCKKEGLTLFLDKEEKNIFFKRHQLSEDDPKKGIFFKAATKRFQIHYMNTSSLILFLPAQKKMFTIK